MHAAGPRARHMDLFRLLFTGEDVLMSGGLHFHIPLLVPHQDLFYGKTLLTAKIDSIMMPI